MLSKPDFVKWARKEIKTTLKMLHAYPKNKGDFKPSENSRTARDIARTFVFEMYLLNSHVLGKKIDRSKFQTYSPDMEVLTEDFIEQTGQVLKDMESLPDSRWSEDVDFAGHALPVSQFAFIMLLDQVHHRGQLSIYVRLAGGKIPSVYGPSADDPDPNIQRL